MTGKVYTQTAGSLATLVIDHEVRRNALSQSMWEQLEQEVATLARNPEVRAVIVRGAGEKAFSAGADIGEFTELARDPERLAANNRAVQSAQAALEALEKPTIAMIYGACVGGGCGLALACDFRLAADNARFAVTPAKLGLMYSERDTRRLYNLVGPANTRDILYRGQVFDAARADQMGMLSGVVPQEDLAAAVASLAQELASASQYSLRGIKAVLARIEGHGERSAEEIDRLFAEAFTGVDCAEGTAAFMEKRSAIFPYRVSEPETQS